MTEIKRKKGFKFIKNNDKDLIRDIKEYFENPKIFLKRNNKIGIGKSSLRQRSINLVNNHDGDNNNIIQSLKGINSNNDNDINLSTIPNLSNMQKTIKEEHQQNNNNNEINTMNISKEINNEENNTNFFNNYFLETKKENNNYNNNKNDNYYINSENNNGNFFNKKIGLNNKNNNKYCITEKNNGKNAKNRITKFSKFYQKKNRKILLFNTKREKNNKENRKIKEKKLIKNESDEKCITNKNRKRPLSVNIHYQYKSSNEIIKYYILGKNREEESKSKGTNYLIPNGVIEKEKRKYLSQEKNLKENIAQNYQNKNMSTYLSKKCHKNEENLLYNNIENYRIKKQLIDYLENKKNLLEKIGEKLWYVDLRRPDFIKKPRGIFLNIGKVDKEIWEPLVEFPMKNVEIIKKAETPHKENNNFEKFLKDKNLYPNNLFNPNNKDKEKNKTKMPNLTEMNDMVIKGRNVILLEKNNFLDNDEKINLDMHKYRVFKDPREKNLKCSKDCLYKLDYQYEDIPYKNKNVVIITSKNKTPRDENYKGIFNKSSKDKKDYIIYDKNKAGKI